MHWNNLRAGGNLAGNLLNLVEVILAFAIMNFGMLVESLKTYGNVATF